MATQDSTDMGIGLAALLSAIALVAAVAVYLSPGGIVAGGGFAVAMVAAGIAVAAVHAYA